MYAVIESSHKVQRVVCMLMSAAIVTLCLSLAALGVESMQRDRYAAMQDEGGYTVTVTALQ